MDGQVALLLVTEKLSDISFQALGWGRAGAGSTLVYMALVPLCVLLSVVGPTALGCRILSCPSLPLGPS